MGFLILGDNNIFGCALQNRKKTIAEQYFGRYPIIIWELRAFNQYQIAGLLPLFIIDLNWNYTHTHTSVQEI